MIIKKGLWKHTPYIFFAKNFYYIMKEWLYSAGMRSIKGNIIIVKIMKFALKYSESKTIRSVPMRRKGCAADLPFLI